ncbi:hypothetical protein [Coxiella-like endosymbiont of Rhipicephalus sanguineus]|nr:hypothetical protein [Coxiella-like endosymbiont of Rhipicephalus sanguineus]
MIYGGSTAGMRITDTIFLTVSQNGLSEAEARKHFLVSRSDWIINGA